MFLFNLLNGRIGRNGLIYGSLAPADELNLRWLSGAYLFRSQPTAPVLDGRTTYNDPANA